MKSPLLGAALLSTLGCQVKPVDCTQDNIDFYDAQRATLEDPELQELIDVEIPNFNSQITTTIQDLLDSSQDYELGCAEEISNGWALTAIYEGGDTVWVDVLAKKYKENLATFLSTTKEEPAYWDAIGYYMGGIVHEYAHEGLPGAPYSTRHSAETTRFTKSFHREFGADDCDFIGATANNTNDLVFDVHAATYCGYRTYLEEKFGGTGL